MATAFANLEARVNAAVMRRLANAMATPVGYLPAAAFSVVFERAHVEVLGLAGGIDATQPVAQALSQDLTDSGVAVGSALDINGTTYYVQALRPDGTGITVLILSLEES